MKYPQKQELPNQSTGITLFCVWIFILSLIAGTLLLCLAEEDGRCIQVRAVQ